MVLAQQIDKKIKLLLESKKEISIGEYSNLLYELSLSSYKGLIEHLNIINGFDTNDLFEPFIKDFLRSVFFSLYANLLGTEEEVKKIVSKNKNKMKMLE